MQYTETLIEVPGRFLVELFAAVLRMAGHDVDLAEEDLENDCERALTKYMAACRLRHGDVMTDERVEAFLSVIARRVVLAGVATEVASRAHAMRRAKVPALCHVASALLRHLRVSTLRSTGSVRGLLALDKTPRTARSRHNAIAQ